MDRSLTMTCARTSFKAARPSLPFVATVTTAPRCVKNDWRISRVSSLSSTTRTWKPLRSGNLGTDTFMNLTERRDPRRTPSRAATGKDFPIRSAEFDVARTGKGGPGDEVEDALVLERG